VSNRLPGFPGAASRQRVAASTADWVRPVPVPAGTALPLEVRPDTEVDLPAWAAEHATTVDGWLHRHGAVLFRGFGIGLDRFAAAAQALAGPALPYRERSSPRTELAPGVYTSTDHPAHQPIPLHNENSYQQEFPARLAFCAVVAATDGGGTPVADCRRVLARLDPQLVRAFARRGVLYQRNYADGVGMGWREAFQRDSRAEVEQYCARVGIAVEWRPDGGLRTRQVRPALAAHPATGEPVWFNHAAFFHLSGHPPDVQAALRDEFGEADLPAHSYYGDGAPIEPDVLAAIRAGYDAETAPVDWRAGDLLVLDNLLVAHGREPFRGERRVVVSMGGLLRRADLPELPADLGAAPR